MWSAAASRPDIHSSPASWRTFPVRRGAASGAAPTVPASMRSRNTRNENEVRNGKSGACFLVFLTPKPFAVSRFNAAPITGKPPQKKPPATVSRTGDRPGHHGRRSCPPRERRSECGRGIASAQPRKHGVCAQTPNAQGDRTGHGIGLHTRRCTAARTQCRFGSGSRVKRHLSLALLPSRISEVPRNRRTTVPVLGTRHPQPSPQRRHIATSIDSKGAGTKNKFRSVQMSPGVLSHR